MKIGDKVRLISTNKKYIENIYINVDWCHGGTSAFTSSRGARLLIDYLRRNTNRLFTVANIQDGFYGGQMCCIKELTKTYNYPVELFRVANEELE